ncbi:TetR/AcrR family transcriptional regulator [Tabrizicola sp. TH137]|uniref:TetR/AcrR family transcriptional regulator n=1 Tax=Tabrizicola sp. TH137 TaxID=2067452 RepID=UPI0013046BE8|nr:TetR-like C-terminal domain-containing protein [Tabrizicola sp. TH137]
MTIGYSPGRLREALLNAGIDLLEEGRARPGLREIARRAGVTPTATYRHFASQDELLAAIAAAGSADLATEFGKIPPSASPKRLLAMAEAYFGFANRRPAMFRLMFGNTVSLRDANGALRPDPAWDMYLDAVASSVGRRRDELIVLEQAVRLWACVHGYVLLSMDERVAEITLDRDLLLRVLDPLVATDGRRAPSGE